MCLWRIGKSFSQLLGAKIKAFDLKAPEISKLLNIKLQATTEVVALSKALTLWYLIEKLLKISQIKEDEVELFLSRINEFLCNIK